MENLLKTELPKRFTDAVGKLYNAFHKGELDAMDCKYCAVGNICNNNKSWDNLGIFASNTFYNDGSLDWYTEDSQNYALKVIKKTGYSPLELQQVELLFIKNCGFKKGTKNEQFKGLCAVVQYLCELDNIPNVMDIQSLFEYENETAKRELSTVFI